MRIGNIIKLVSLVFVLSACSTTQHRHHYAPVMDVEGIERIPASGMHRMSSGETLYSIAWRYGLDYRHLAQLNHLDKPYVTHTGEVIYLRKNAMQQANVTQSAPSTSMPVVTVPVSQSSAAIKSSKTKPATPMVRDSREPTAPVKVWRWPAHGPLMHAFTPSNKGINIGGPMGTSIYASAAGKVVYSGDGLRGYGNLVIIEHNHTFLSAYAHNSNVLVSEGQWVKAGQKIAEMGNSGSKKIMLHFEIRRNGLPVNPLFYLARHP